MITIRHFICSTLTSEWTRTHVLTMKYLTWLQQYSTSGNVKRINKQICKCLNKFKKDGLVESMDRKFINRNVKYWRFK